MFFKKKSIAACVGIFILSALSLRAQTVVNEIIPNVKYAALYKTLLPYSPNAPEWVHHLYSDSIHIDSLVRQVDTYFNGELPSTKELKKFILEVGHSPLPDELSGDGSRFIQDPNAPHLINYKFLLQTVVRLGWYDSNGYVCVDPAKVATPENISSPSNWEFLGPKYSNNRDDFYQESRHGNVVSIDQPYSDTSRVAAIGQSDGVYISNNKGRSWQQIGADVFAEPLNAVKFDPQHPDTIYVASRKNIYATYNSGATWTSLYYNPGLKPIEIAVSPSNPNVIIVVGNSGLYRSANGGSSWTQLWTEVTFDVQFSTSRTGNIVYAARTDTAKNITEIWKSTDAGVNWAVKNSGWFIPSKAKAIDNEGVRIGLTDADTNRLYAVLLASDTSKSLDNNYIGIYRSDNGGNTWYLPEDSDLDGIPNNEPGGPYSLSHWNLATIDLEGLRYQQGFYNCAIEVSDFDPDVFVVGMLSQYVSTNGGKTYRGNGGYRCTGCPQDYRHPDHQDFLINGTDIFIATDGGFDVYDTSFTLIESRNIGMSTSDFWHLSHGWNEDIWVGGRYHNGNVAYRDIYGDGAAKALGGAEAATGYINFMDHAKVHHSDINSYYLPRDTAEKVYQIPKLNIFPNEHYYWQNSEIAIHPQRPETMFLGNENKLYKSNNGGTDFTAIHVFDTITDNWVLAIEISRVNPKVMFVTQRIGNSGCALHKSVDGGYTWSQVVLPYQNQQAYISLNENDVLFFASGSYSGSGKLYKSTDFGASWTDLSGNGMLSRLDGICVQLGTNNGIYVWGDKEVQYRNDTMSYWADYDTGLPKQCKVNQLIPFYAKNKLRLSTSMGVWEASMYETSNPIAQPVVSDTIYKCSLVPIQFDSYSVICHDGATWMWHFEGASSVNDSTIRNPKVFYSTPGTYDVRLTIVDSLGNSDTAWLYDFITVVPSNCDYSEHSDSAIYLSSNDAYVHASMPIGVTSEFTALGWIKPLGAQEDYTGIFNFQGPGPKPFIFNFTKNYKLGVHTPDAAENYWQWTPFAIDTNQWNFVAVKYTPTKITIYGNDEVWSFTGNFPSMDINSLEFGKSTRETSRRFKGLMDEWKFFDRALTDEEIRIRRHIIAFETDTSSLAHYQFNVKNVNSLYDVQQQFHLEGTADALIVPSTAPIGGGKVSYFDLNQTTSVNDSTTGIEVRLSNVGVGGLCLNRLSTLPYNIPSSAYSGMEYWIINSYNSSIGYLDTISLKSFNPLNYLELDSIYFVQRRPSNSENQAEWTIQGSGLAKNANEYVKFHPDSVLSNGQFLVTKTRPSIFLPDTIYICSSVNADLTQFENSLYADQGLEWTYFTSTGLSVSNPTSVGPGEYVTRVNTPNIQNFAFDTLWVVTSTITADGDVTICLGESLTLGATGSDSYIWTDSNGILLPSTMVTPQVTTMYYVSGVSFAGCMATDSILVSVLPIDTSLTILGNLALCPSESVTLSGSSGQTYDWNTGHSGSSLTITSPGTYYAIISSPNGCSDTSSTYHVSSLPGVSLPTIQTNGSNWVTSGTASSFFVQSTPNYTYTWNIKGGSITFGQGTDSIYVNWGAPDTSAWVWLSISNGYCTDSLGIKIIVSALSLEQSSSINLKAFPNPNDGNFYVVVGDYFQNASYSILDNTGRVLTVGSIREREQKFDLSNYPNGSYQIKLEKESIIRSITIFKH